MRSVLICLFLLLASARAPAQVTPPRLELATVDSVTLWWEPIPEPDLAGYRVYVRTASGTYDKGIDVGRQTSYTVKGLTTGDYAFVVTAMSAAKEESGRSNEVTTTIIAPLTIVFAIATDATSKTATLIWKTSAPADSRIEYSYLGGPFVSLLVDSAAQATTDHLVRLGSLKPGKVYSYEIISADAGGARASWTGTFRTR